MITADLFCPRRTSEYGEFGLCNLLPVLFVWPFHPPPAPISIPGPGISEILPAIVLGFDVTKFFSFLDVSEGPEGEELAAHILHHVSH
eukprot:858245-Amphidinium_carterae.2